MPGGRLDAEVTGELMRRGLTTAITLLVLCGLLVVAALWGWNALFARVPGTTAVGGPASCDSAQVRPGDRLRSGQVRVSVFNAGSRAGLAGRTLAGLQARGFDAGEVGNAPANLRVVRAQVRTTKRKDAAARLVARQLGSRVPVRVTGANLGPGVDVVVGDGFRGLVKARRWIRVTTPQRVCASPSNSDSGS